ncbi:MAG TPA: rhodanese-related sulfurtransferase [Herpetosiphonaceae bacterium]
MTPTRIIALYHFADLADYAGLREPLLALARDGGVRGTLLLAAEGINGTIAGPAAGVQAVLDWLAAVPQLAGLAWKESWADEQPFVRLRIRLKREIVTLGVPGVDPARGGAYVKPEDWNALISQPDVLVLDTRNHFEASIGSFAGAVDPGTVSFSQFPQYVRDHLDPERQPKVAMFCTGGIRCEKASAYLRQQGFAEVYQLEGGILNYLASVPREESLWRGECFVFDGRISVDHDLRPGSYELRRACGHPRPAGGEDGDSCPHCPPAGG